MVYYAQNGGVLSGDVPPSGPHLTISEEEYLLAINGMLDGKIVTIDGGFSVKTPVVFDLPEPVVLEPEPVVLEPEPYVEPEPPIEYRLFVERTRRLEAGFDYDFGGTRGVHHIGTSKRDMEGWNVVSTIANAALALGDGDYQITIKTDTGIAEVTALEWQEVLLAASSFQQPIYQSYFALKSRDPIPSDFAADEYWQGE